MATKNRRAKMQMRLKRRKPLPSTERSVVFDPVATASPVAWAGEAIEDAAIFDHSALAKLDAKIASEVSLIRQALRSVADGQGGEVNVPLESISRRSPLSEWRLFVRGLIDWYENRFDEAQECWKRLDSNRRPYRIASALIASQRDDLSSLLAAATTETPDQEALSNGRDQAVLSAAKRVRQTREERPALAEATRELSQPERIPREFTKVLLGPERLSWLMNFCDRYRAVEPQLVDALQQAMLDRLMKQPYADLNSFATSRIPGPVHDPKNLLSQAFYHRGFRDGKMDADKFLNEYLTDSLATNDRLSTPLRAAIKSEAFATKARRELQNCSKNFFTNRFVYTPLEVKNIASHYRQSLVAYPANAAVHREYVDWIRENSDHESSTKYTREPFEELLLPAMEAWTEGVPDEIEPRLWLVDQYLENEQLEAAKPHVQWLAGSRHADPRVRAIAWKWEVLDTMRLCRRKSWLVQASEKLDGIEKLWPTWLTKDWMSYLRAALLLRQDKIDEYQSLRLEIRQQQSSSGKTRSACSDAVMMLAAAQHMRVPTDTLKPLRAAVDLAVTGVKSLTTKDLIETASFFWDLHRTSLFYPAYRMHGGKFAGELFDRIKAGQPMRAERPADHGSFRDALFWLTLRRSFNDAYVVDMPPSLPLRIDRTTYAAIMIQSRLLTRAFMHRKLQSYVSEIKLLREAGNAEQDPYYRFWFNSLAEQAEIALAKSQSNEHQFAGFDFFGASTSGDNTRVDDSHPEVEDDEDSTFDPDCDCEHCKAERMKSDLPQPSSSVDDTHQFVPRPPVMRVDSPPDPDFKRTRPKNPMDKKRKKRR
jgi:hypothetical protein